MSYSNRTKNSIYNAVSAIVLTIINGVFGMIVTRLVIGEFGSDFNGLNSTANQIINVLLILEGGLTLASNVALFKPISDGDYETANGILKATRNKFKRIGIAFLVVGLIVAVGYSFAVKTSLLREFVFSIIFMAVIPQAVNLYFATTYRVLIQTQQKEYIISLITSITVGLGHAVNAVLIMNHGHMWMIRFVTMCFALINSWVISRYTRKHCEFIDYSVESTPGLIKGTNDVLAQKITGLIYTSWPIVFLSVSSNAGTMLASVYAVYNSVFVMLKALLHGIIDAPRLSFGQMLTEKKVVDVWNAFKEYEYAAIIFTYIAMTTACGMILPFIRIYTRGINDINYYDKRIAILMVLVGSIEMLHIPSGHMINMSGNFKISKYFQIIACVILLSSMTVLGSVFGVYGILESLLIVAVLLAVLEIGFIHTRFFKHKINEFFKMLIPYIVLGTLFSSIEMNCLNVGNTIKSILLYSVICFTVNSTMGVIIGYLFNRNEFVHLLFRGKMIFNWFAKL